MRAWRRGCVEAEVAAALVADVGRGFTVLCIGAGAALLALIARETGETGLLLVAGCAPPVGPVWRSLRADPAALPLRAHLLDAVILDCSTVALSGQAAAELRRTLAPGGFLRALVPDEGAAIEATLRDAALRTSTRLRFADGKRQVLVARGP